MPKTKSQLDREIADALSGSSPPPPTPAARFKIHGTRRGINNVEYAETPAEADRIARAMAKKGLLITVLAQEVSLLCERRARYEGPT